MEKENNSPDFLVILEDNEITADAWIEKAALYFTKGWLDNFFAKENLRKIKLVSVQENLLEAVASGLEETVTSFRKEPRQEKLPQFELVCEKNPEEGYCDIFVRKV